LLLGSAAAASRGAVDDGVKAAEVPVDPQD